MRCLRVHAEREKEENVIESEFKDRTEREKRS